MKKATILALLSLTVMAFALGACKSDPAPSAAPPAPAGYVDHGK